MQSTALYWDKPVDFFIRTQASLRYFLLKTRRERNGYKPSRLMRLTLSLLRNMHIGTLDIILPDARKLRFEGQKSGSHALLRIHNDKAINAFAKGGRLGFCEAYLEGFWSSPDMAVFFKLMIENEQHFHDILDGQNWYRMLSKLSHFMRPNSRRGSRKNIYRHYDIGNDFYAAWLDPSMTYSSACYKTGAETLEQAQVEKYAVMATRLDLKKGDHVLEIGCGWGGFAEYAASVIGAHVTAVTISKAQYDYAQKRLKQAGVSDLIDLRLQDYRDIEGQFDAVASIEMFEAVGETYWPVFFNKLHALLKQGGRANLQVITIEEKSFENYRNTPDYIQRYIFPGGMLPTIQILQEQAETTGLVFEDYIAFGHDYATTLKHWNTSFQDAWSDLKGEKMDERFKRLWEQYLCYCQAGFEAGTIDVVQAAMHKS